MCETERAHKHQRVALGVLESEKFRAVLCVSMCGWVWECEFVGVCV